MLRTTALALTALTGFSGLVYEVAWQKYVATLLARAKIGKRSLGCLKHGLGELRFVRKIL